MKTDKDNESEMLARIAALEAELHRLMDLVGVEDRESIENVLSSDGMAERAESELADLRKQLTEREGEAIDEQNLRFDAEKKLERAKAELERVKKVCAEMQNLIREIMQEYPRTLQEFKQRAIAALSSDAGRDYIHKSVVGKRDAVIKEMREALAALVDENPKSDILCDDGFTFSYQKNSRVHNRALEALARAKEALFPTIPATGNPITQQEMEDNE